MEAFSFQPSFKTYVEIFIKGCVGIGIYQVKEYALS